MPPQITICGSMQFSQQMRQLQQELEKLGWVVLTPDLSESSTAYQTLPDHEKSKAKKKLINRHFEKIKKSDAILVANYDKKGVSGYIGSNTLMEIAVAHAFHKKIYVLHQLENQSCEEEVRALTTRFLDGDVANLEQ
jgi:hypothetical protein